MNFAIRVRLTITILVCMSWCLPAPGQETILPAGRTTASSASPAGPIFDATHAANWVFGNRIALSIGAAGTAQSGSATPQATPFPKNAPARPGPRTPAPSGKRWTAARIAVLAAGVGLTGTGAYMLATGSTAPTPAAPSCGPTATGGAGYTVTCGGSGTQWDQRKKAGVVLLGIGVPLSLAGLLVH
jgi:hypothetical protein